MSLVNNMLNEHFLSFSPSVAISVSVSLHYNVALAFSTSDKLQSLIERPQEDCLWRLNRQGRNCYWRLGNEICALEDLSPAIMELTETDLSDLRVLAMEISRQNGWQCQLISSSCLWERFREKERNKPKENCSFLSRFKSKHFQVKIC